TICAAVRRLLMSPSWTYPIRIRTLITGGPTFGGQTRRGCIEGPDPSGRCAEPQEPPTAVRKRIAWSPRAMGASPVKYFVPELAPHDELLAHPSFEDKFGGLPWGLPPERWPLCASCGGPQCLFVPCRASAEVIVTRKNQQHPSFLAQVQALGVVAQLRREIQSRTVHRQASFLETRLTNGFRTLPRCSHPAGRDRGRRSPGRTPVPRRPSRASGPRATRGGL